MRIYGYLRASTKEQDAERAKSLLNDNFMIEETNAGEESYGDTETGLEVEELTVNLDDKPLSEDTIIKSRITSCKIQERSYQDP